MSEPIVDAYNFSGIGKLADVGGGHGLLLSAILKRHARMAGVLYDAPSVIRGSGRVLEAHEVYHRCELISGDFFQSVPRRRRIS